MQHVTKTCSSCGTPFECGSAGSEPCWCNAYPPLEPDLRFKDCFCPRCLALRTKTNGPAAKSTATSLIEGEDYYLEGEAVVFTAAYHLKRGSCCGSGCRHCPYD